MRRWSTAARWALLAVVLAGLFGMHVLTADDGSGAHGSLPMIGRSSHDDMSGSAALPTAAIPVMVPADSGAPADLQLAAVGPGSGGTDHSAMAGCILFLVVGGTALALLILRYRGGGQVAGLGRVTRVGLTDMRRRGPPDRPRLALCVIRV